MRKRVVVLGMALALITAGSVGYVVAGAQLYWNYHLYYANYQLSSDNPCNTLVAWSPPRVVYTAFYVNQPSFLSVRYRSDAPQTLRITVSIPRFTQEQTVQVQAAAVFQSIAFKPPLLDGHVLDALIGPGQMPAQVHLRVQTASGVACDNSSPLTLMSREWMHWSDPATGDNSAYLAGWITPQAPAILDLVGRTDQWIEQRPATYGGITALRGYDAGRATASDVRNQVNALFDTLQSVYHIHYASDNVVFGRDQRIRLPQDVLTGAAPTGMCVETSAILASAVEHLGMRPYVVIVPGHAFLGVALGVDLTAPIEFWETSDLNGSTGTQANLDGNSEYRDATQANTIQTVIDVQYERVHGIEPIE
jgi:hypothetical protein